jgi:hypothetical protein
MKEKIINEWNQTKYDFQDDYTIIRMFEDQVNKTPYNIALVFEETNLTYCELNERSNQFASYLTVFVYASTANTTKTWTGADDAISWNNSLNWNPEGIPEPSDEVVIPGGHGAAHEVVLAAAE